MKLITVMLSASSTFLLGAISGSAQKQISGIIKDSATKKFVPYASVVLRNLNMGSYADSNGVFNIKYDSISFPVNAIVSSVGYKSSIITILSNNQTHIIELSPTTTFLPIVEVTQRRGDFDEKAFKKIRPQYFFNINKEFPIEIASQIIFHNDSLPIKLKGLIISAKPFGGNIPSRLHIYESTHLNIPGIELTKRTIYLRSDQVVGNKIYIDLSADQIILKERTFFVGVDWPFSSNNEGYQRASILAGITHRVPDAISYSRFVNLDNFSWAKLPMMEGEKFSHPPTLIIKCYTEVVK
jgi:hypothetical protein